MFLETDLVVDYLSVIHEDYLSAITTMSETGLDVNNSLALKVMRESGVKEIYSFDRGFEYFVKRLS
ncbi:MAG: hypothetical protein R6U44_07300 [Archaeoglobaceae archaeon]